MKKLLKSSSGITFIVWTLLCVLGGIYGSTSVKENSEQVLTLALFVWLAGLIIWGFIKFLKWFNPERRHAANDAALKVAAIVIVIVVISSIASAQMTASKPTPTQAEPWKSAMTTMGLSPDTQRPSKADLPNLVCAHFPQSAKVKTYCEKASDALWNNDIYTFQTEYGKALNEASREADQKARDAVKVHNSSVEFIIACTFIFAILGAFIGKSIDYVGKISGTALWSLLTALLWYGAVSVVKTNAMAEVFSIGAGIRVTAVILTIAAVAFGFFREGVKASGFGKTLLKIVFAVIASALGLGLDSLLQVPILTGYVASGKIGMDDAYVMYQLGAMFAGGFTAMISTGVLFFQAAGATPAKDRR